MAKQPWFKKGRIGRGLESLKGSPERPFKVTQCYIYWYLTDRDGYKQMQLALRGNSKQRRQQRRAIERYVNGE